MTTIHTIAVTEEIESKAGAKLISAIDIGINTFSISADVKRLGLSVGIITSIHDKHFTLEVDGTSHTMNYAFKSPKEDFAKTLRSLFKDVAEDRAEDQDNLIIKNNVISLQDKDLLKAIANIITEYRAQHMPDVPLDAEQQKLVQAR